MKAVATLNRRLDVVFAEMEIRWATYKQDRRDERALALYVASLRRANRLWKLIKSLP